MRALVFYPLVIAAAAGAILLSLGQALTPAKPAAQAGALESGALAFGPRALSHYRPSSQHLAYVVQDWLAPPTGLHIATKRKAGRPTPATPGLRLQFTPETAQRLAGRPLRVTLSIKPMPYLSTAPILAVSAQSSAGAAWISHPITTQNNQLVFDFPASAQPIIALGFWPYTDQKQPDFDLGIEITRVAVSFRG